MRPSLRSSPGRGGGPTAGWWRGFSTGRTGLGAPSTTPLRAAVTLPVPGRISGLAIAACTALCLAAPAAAQDPNAAPAFGTVYLAAGFTADPRSTSVVAGGPIAASSVGGGCRGYVSQAPTLRLDYSGSGAPLIISADASADTTLLIRAPDGRFYCDDDSGTRGLNPAIRYDPPRAGRYDIWVGSFRAGETVRARLYFSGSTSQ